MKRSKSWREVLPKANSPVAARMRDALSSQVVDAPTSMESEEDTNRRRSLTRGVIPVSDAGREAALTALALGWRKKRKERQQAMETIAQAQKLLRGKHRREAACQTEDGGEGILTLSPTTTSELIMRMPSPQPPINMPSPLSSPVDHLATMMASSPSPPPPPPPPPPPLPLPLTNGRVSPDAEQRRYARPRADEESPMPSRSPRGAGPQIRQGGGVRVWTQRSPSSGERRPMVML